MSCEKVRASIDSLAERWSQGGLAGEERDAAMAHVAGCRVCGEELEAAQGRRVALRSLAVPPLPAKLAANLRVLASHERARQLTRITWRARWETACDRV